jgi:hypothetical protein
MTHTQNMSSYRKSLELDAIAAGFGGGAHLMSTLLLTDLMYEPDKTLTSESKRHLMDYFTNGQAEEDLALPAEEFARLAVVRRMFPVPQEMPCLTNPDEFHDHTLTPASRQALVKSAKAMRVYQAATQRFLDHFHVPSELWNPDSASSVIRAIAENQNKEIVFEVCMMMFRVMASTFMLAPRQFNQLAAAFSHKTFRDMCRDHRGKMCGLNAALSWSDFISLLKSLRSTYDRLVIPEASIRLDREESKDHGIEYPISDAADAQEAGDDDNEWMKIKPTTSPLPEFETEPDEAAVEPANDLNEGNEDNLSQDVASGWKAAPEEEPEFLYESELLDVVEPTDSGVVTGGNAGLLPHPSAMATDTLLMPETTMPSPEATGASIFMTPPRV